MMVSPEIRPDGLIEIKKWLVRARQDRAWVEGRKR